MARPAGLVTLAFDTNVVIDLMRGEVPVRQAYMQARQAGGDFVVSVLVVQELLFGAELSARPVAQRRLIDEWLAGVQIVSYETTDADTAARAQARMQRSGVRAPYGDFLVGAHALARGHALVTANTPHFENIPGLPLLDWRRGPNTLQDGPNA